uniref:DUF5131 family protein n=1 Tax=Caudovirales sp. ctrNG92 TaxID=2827638 RepID=A0A8S5SE04_9CAUD|nr:MAG TPA: Protein of unknown function (DUF5131) [Caudovirales sp. ctrNG92]
MGRETKIDWADATWNPVTGCLHGCEYCYARRIAERFGLKQMPILTDYPVLHEPVRCTDTYAYMRDTGISTGKIQPYPFDFLPTFHRYKLDEPQHWKQPRNIFVCSMADLFGDWVPDEWIAEVFKACEAAPQHRYLFLTKNPKRYMELKLNGKLPKQHWYGTSVTRKDDRDFFAPGYNTFVSIEPILESFSDEKYAAYRQMVQPWVILGAETGNRKNKIVPKKEWITELVDYYSKFGYTKFFMKDSLRSLMGDDFRQELPWKEGL